MLVTHKLFHKLWRSAAPGLFGAVGLGAITLICFRLQVGLASAALLYLMVVVLASLNGSIISSAVVSVLSVGCLDYFFTTPRFTFAMNDLPGYVAIIVFLTTSLVITRLVSRVQCQASEALSSVSYRVIEAEERERQRIAHDLHENIGQRMTLLVIAIEQLKADSLKAVDMPGRLDAIRKQSVEILTEVKTLAHELYSPRLEYLGIAGVVSSFCRDFGQKNEVEIDFTSEGFPGRVSPDISLCLFRVLQEALHNAVEHSGVRQFVVRLNAMPDEIHFTVSDSGAGFELETEKKARGLGLNRMRERLKLVKGSLSVDSEVKRGTTIHAYVPVTLGRHSVSVDARLVA